MLFLNGVSTILSRQPLWMGIQPCMS